MNEGRHAPLSKVVIVGGGSAGWMTAAALSRMVAAGVSVTLVESEEIGIVGVGEATIPSLLDFNRALHIDEHQFVAETMGTFKLGIEFVDWGGLGQRYIHPFGKIGRGALGVPFHQIWLRQYLLGDPQRDPGDLGDYALCTVAARSGRFAKPAGGPDSVLASLGYAYHFDASRYAAFLRRLAEANGVVRVEGRIGHVPLDPETGHIAAVELVDGRRVEGELFIDCSGFRSLLLGEALGVPYRDWQHWLPCDRAIAVPAAPPGPAVPYTRSTADSAGWRWRIPLQHRVGNGHVFSSAFLEEEEAQRRLLAGLDGAPLADPRTIRFVAGRRETMWQGNCLAIGLASGFIEPLESTSIHLIQSAIFRLMALFPDTGFDPLEIAQFNRLMIEEYEHIRDFIILHYHATARTDSDFWNHCRTMALPDTLRERIELWQGKGRIFPAYNSLFTEESWIAVLMGQNIVPRAADPLTAIMPVDESTRYLAHVREMIARTAQGMPAHQDYIARHCAGRA